MKTHYGIYYHQRQLYGLKGNVCLIYIYNL